MRLSAVVLAVVALAGLARAMDVPLTVEEPIGADRKLEVVSGGIPLPEGQYKDPAAFSLHDGPTEVPVQVSPTVKYPDGSLHWVLVSFPANAPANSSKVYTLKDVPSKATVANPVVVRESGDVVEVSNGLIAFAVNKANFNGLDWVKVNGKEVLKAPKAGIAANGKGGPAKPTHFDFVYRGPIRTTLYVKTPIGDQAAPTSAMAITLCAGESVIRIDHNLRNGGVKAPKIDVAGAQLCFGIAGEFTAGNKGGGAAPRPSFGWQELSGPADLLVFMRHGGTAHAGGKDLALSYDVSAAAGQLAVDLSMSKDKPITMEEGEHKVTEVVLDFGRSSSASALTAPLHARAACDFYAKYDSMGVGRGFGSLADETETYRLAGWVKADDPKKMPRMKTNPDLWFNWLDVHATSEVDQIQGMVFGYIRTGQRGYLDQAAAWARYYRAYYMYRTDDFTCGKEGGRKVIYPGAGRMCGCHTYGVGLFNYALITGGVDDLEAAFDLAEVCNGTSAGTKPGADLGYWGSRGFVRCYLAIARAYDVARTREWRDRVIHTVDCLVQARDRDQRGFINHGYVSGHAQQYINDVTKQGSAPAAVEMQEKEGIKIEKGLLTLPQYGAWPLKEFGTWPEAMESEGHVIAYYALRGDSDPAAQLAADNAMDLAIVKSELGLHYVFDPVQKCVYYYMFLDYPIPGFAPLWKGGRWKDRIPKGATDSWYTKWWPNPMAAGYLLTGDKAMRERCQEMLWWGLSRGYVNAPVVPEGEAPPYSAIDTSGKGDWMTPCSLAFGVLSHLKKDETPPPAIRDLKAKRLADGKVELSWTSPSDTGGKLANYQAKWANQPMDDYPVDGEHWRKNWKDSKVTVTYWNFAHNVVGEPTPGNAGKAEKMVVDVPAGKAWLSIRSFDDGHNRSAMSNVVDVE